jgi:hypothetical protein
MSGGGENPNMGKVGLLPSETEESWDIILALLHFTKLTKLQAPDLPLS